MLPVSETVLPVSATMSNEFRLFDKVRQIEHVQFVSTLSNGRNFTIKSFNIAVFGNKFEFCFDKVERCFDNVAAVDGALEVIDNEKF